MWSWLARANRAGGGLWVDVSLYGLSALFAWASAAGSTLAPHRAWGSVATAGYAAAAAVALGQLALRSVNAGPSVKQGASVQQGRSAPQEQQGRPTEFQRSTGPPRWPWGNGARAALAGLTWGATALVPLVWQALERASGETDRAQEEVLVIEDGGRRLLQAGTPYLDRATIAALPTDERLLAYLPYQPAMALFGVPRAVDPTAPWWSDARVWFALVTAAALVAAFAVLRRSGVPPAALVRGLQAATVLPVCALTLATGGDDLPVLALCLLALALAATGRLGLAGLAVGTAAALKLIAWPVAVVLGVHALTKDGAGRHLAGAVGVPLMTGVPALLINPGAVIENVLAFPSGRGLVTSPAASPLPGYLIAHWVPGGRAIAIGLLLATAIGIALLLVRRPPPTAADASLVCGLGLLAAVLLLPATRFGYLLYPAAFLVWAAALRVPDRLTR